MSVNGGFPTKAVDTQYNTLVYNMVYLLQYRIRKFYTKESVNEHNFRHVLLKTYTKSVKLEASKFLPPKFSEALEDLVDLMYEMKAEASPARAPQPQQLMSEFTSQMMSESPITKSLHNQRKHLSQV